MKGWDEMNINCKICNRVTDLFSVEIEDDGGEKYTLKVCGTCWDIIAKVAEKALNERLEKIEKKLAYLNEMLEKIEGK